MSGARPSRGAAATGEDPAREASEPRTLPGESGERKYRVLSQETPSITSGIADAIVIKERDVYFLAPPDGSVPLCDGHGFGLYFHDCRFLDGYTLKLGGAAPHPLMATGERGSSAVFQLTNNEIRDDGEQLVRKETLGVRWERTLDGEHLVLRDRLTFQNYGLERIELSAELTFRARFQDIFVIRGLLEASPGELEPPVWEGGELWFRYRGADGIDRALGLHLDSPPDRCEGASAHYRLVLPPRGTHDLSLTLAIVEEERGAERGKLPRGHRPAAGRAAQARPDEEEPWIETATRIESEELVLDRTLERSLRDLRVLRSSLDGHGFFAAGVPWFTTLFGRDSLITALQVLAFDPAVAAGTLRLLARYQATAVDTWRDAQPGKILHELRVGELARLGEIPHTPYYGTIDATPLFLVLMARHATWTGNLELFDELRGAVDAALRWIDEHGDLDGDGYVEYASPQGRGLVNQGWKDSGDAIVDADGALAEPPIALVEVQAYVYAAKREIAVLFRRAGDASRADALEREAETLRRRFERDFWLEEEGTYALALLGEAKRPAAVVTSNAGHALWAGIAAPERAVRVAASLMTDAMWSGWGIRTLSRDARAYNPLGYHLGTVWPHDNGLIAAGFHRYGFENEMLRILSGILEAAMHFDYRQLPELFAGFGREDYGVPVRYPVACHPQAWAAGTLPYLVHSLLGLEPEAFERRLRVVRPRLPDFLDRLSLRRLRVGEASVDLWFERARHGVAVQVTGIEGNLQVLVEP